MKKFLGNLLKVLLIVLAVLLIIGLLSPVLMIVVPFAFIYFMYDRTLKHREIMKSKVKLDKPKFTIPSIYKHDYDPFKKDRQAKG